MAPPKRYWARLRLPREFLKTLPDFPTPISKSRLKRLAAEERRALLASSLSGGSGGSVAGSKAGSPSPSISESVVSLNDADSIDIDNDGAESSTEVDSKTTPAPSSTVKEENTPKEAKEATPNDKSASHDTAKSWYKGPRQFKTFSGFKVTYTTYRNNRAKPEPSQADADSSTPRLSPESTAAATPVG